MENNEKNNAPLGNETESENLTNQITQQEVEHLSDEQSQEQVLAAEEHAEQEPTIEQGGEQQSLSKTKIDKTKVLQTIKMLAKRWFIDAFSGMAAGLFVTLIAGTILAQIGGWIGNNAFGNLVSNVAGFAKMLMGAGIGVGIAHSLKCNKLVMFSAAVTGLIGAFADKLTAGGAITLAFGLPGNPIGAYIVALITIEIAKYLAGKTKVDIIVIPLSMMILAFAAVYCAWPFIKLVELIGKGIAIATDVTPFVMGVIISVSMGILLTLPTSSAAMWVAISMPIMGVASGLTVGNATYDAMALAGGAAVVGCSCQMVGFAVASFRENKWGGLIAQGIGTSMLQIPNLMKKPRIMLPQIIASAIVGPLSTCVFQLRCTPSGGGMGTSGLVGVFGVIEQSQLHGLEGWKIGLGIALLMFVIPAVVCFFVSEFMRKKNFISFGDQALEL